MKRDISVLLSAFVLVVGSSAAAGAGLATGVVYVCERDTDQCLEFGPNQSFYMHGCYAFVTGTCQVAGNEIVLTVSGGTTLKAQLQGQTLVDQDGDRWVTNMVPQRIPNVERKPVTVTVVDGKTQQPVSQYAYGYSLETPAGREKPYLARMQSVDSTSGTFVVDAPLECELFITVATRDFLPGYGAYRHNYAVKDGPDRRVVIELQRGITVTGTVSEAANGKPIAGAEVAPVVFCPPLFVPDHDRAVRSDALGRFAVHGVEPGLGVNVFHPDFVEVRERSLDEKQVEEGRFVYGLDVTMESGGTVKGIVVDPEGRTLEGVEISDGTRRTVRSEKDGRFVMHSVSGESGSLRFRKAGYIDVEVRTEVWHRDLYVQMEQLFSVRGTVMDPDGHPVTAYRIMAGEGKTPQRFQCASSNVITETGEFMLPVEASSTHWLAVRATGFAVWEGWVDVQRDMPPVRVALHRGVQLRGRVVPPAGLTNALTVRLSPQRPCPDSFIGDPFAFEQFGMLEEPIGQNGGFDIAHVSPGDYTLRVDGDGITPVEYTCHVGTSGRDVGSIRLEGVGIVGGQVFEKMGCCEAGKCPPPAPWAYADGTANHRFRSISFKADREGRFRAGNVPVGKVSVGFEYNITADIIGSHRAACEVMAGATTDVTVIDAAAVGSTVLCRVTAGDGSRRAFDMGLGWDAREVESWSHVSWIGLDVTLRTPGHPDQSVEGQRVSIGTNYPIEVMVEGVKPGTYEAWADIRASLLAGAVADTAFPAGRVTVHEGSNTVAVVFDPGVMRGSVRQLAKPDPAVVIHLLDVSNRVVRRAICAEDGMFAVSFLAPGRYSLVAHDHDAGWGVAGPVEVRVGTATVVEVSMQAGASVQGLLHADWEPRAREYRVEAIDPRGIRVVRGRYHRELQGVNGERYRLGHLWPGTWTINVVGDDRVLRSTNVVVKGAETRAVDLWPEPPVRPARRTAE